MERSTVRGKLRQQGARPTRSQTEFKPRVQRRDSRRSPPTSARHPARCASDYLAELENDLKVLPYHKLIVDSLGAPAAEAADGRSFGDYGISPAQLFRPVLLELIWSYWHEEGMLVQTMNAISRRFQNRRGTAARATTRCAAWRSTRCAPSTT